MIIDDIVDPAELTAFIRNLPAPLTNELDSYLPDRTLPDIEAMWDSVNRTNRVAKFRTYDAETPIAARDTAFRNRIMLPPLGIKQVIGEYERLVLNRLAAGGDNMVPVIEAIYNDAELLRGMVINRMQLAKGDVLTDGKFTLAGEGNIFTEADFGLSAVPGVITAPAGALWTDRVNAKALTDLITWRRQYRARNGENPGRIRMSEVDFTDFLNNAEVKANIIAATYTAIVTPNQQDVNNLLASNSMPPIELTDGRLDVDGTDTRLIPEGKVHMLPEANRAALLGETYWGITAESLELGQGENPALAFNELPGIVGVVTRMSDSVKRVTQVGAVGMPVIRDPKRITIATVR